MLKICNTSSKNYSILFNKKNTTCIKFGDLIKNGEKAFLDGSDIVWKDNVRHFGNFVDSTCNDDFDCNAKKSLFIAYFNKMMANYSSLQPTVLFNLFKSYCCSFYGSPLWKFNSTGFEKCCKAWNIAVRKLLHLPFKTHTWILGPLIGQMRISTQLQFRNFCFLLDVFNSNNHIVKSCMRAALYNANTCIGYKLAFYRYKFDLDMYNNCTSRRKLINDHNLSYHQLAIISNLSTLINIRAGNCYIDGFTINDLDILIEGIATGKACV